MHAQYSMSLKPILLCITITFLPCYSDAPKLTVIFIVDQLAYSYFDQINTRYLKGGLRTLLHKGINFTNAHMPHGMPATATGHVALNTGTTAQYHGIVGNGWFDENNTYIGADDDFSGNATVFGASQQNGKSAVNIKVDGISDQFIMNTRAGEPRHVYAFSMKSRSAIGTANKLGKAIWFDKKMGGFTSSRAYFEELPEWLTTFNEEHRFPACAWKPIYPLNHKAYATADPAIYKYTRNKKPFINSPIPSVTDTAHYYNYFIKTPASNVLLLDLARACITHHFSKKNNDSMIIWISLSSLDSIGHAYGPQSYEAIDTIYQIDRALQPFMRFIQRKIGMKKTLFALSADHGIVPILEYMQEKGFNDVHRILTSSFIHDINTSLEHTYSTSNIITRFKNPSVYINANVLKGITPTTRNALYQDIKTAFMKHPGIKQVWTYDELMNTAFDKHDVGRYFKNQLFPNRSGQLIVQTFPYTIISKWAEGTSHKTPYEPNTHVPLILYQAGKFEDKTIHDRVETVQFATTIAEILNIPKPSATTYSVLPSIFDEPTGF